MTALPRLRWHPDGRMARLCSSWGREVWVVLNPDGSTPIGYSPDPSTEPGWVDLTVAERREPPDVTTWGPPASELCGVTAGQRCIDSGCPCRARSADA